MPIGVVACVSNYKNKLAIGRNNGLLFKLKEDLQLFKNLTKDKLSEKSKLCKNVVVMGRKTWYSIPSTIRPLKDRINIVLTRDKQLRKISPFPWSSFLKAKVCNNVELFCDCVMKKDTYFWTLEEFHRFYKYTNANAFVIGGSEIYKIFLDHPEMKPENVYLTEVTNTKWLSEFEPDCFMQPLDTSYKLIGVSDQKYDNKRKVNYRFLTYRRDRGVAVTDEAKYLGLCKDVLNDGRSRDDRTGVGTYSVFGSQLRFDISQSVPLLTTKRVPWKHVIQELLWFMRGDTDAKILQKEGVKIWDGNTSRDFLDNRGLHHYPEGVLGAGYGFQWRFFGAKYTHAFSDTSKIDTSKISGFDQLEYVIRELKENPMGRRALMSYWNPPDFEKTALVPCHFSCQFYVEYRNGEPHLNCHFTMRSTDVFLGLPFNIFSYAVLTYIIATKCSMKPGTLVYTGGDVHIYKNHIEQVKEQLTRTLRPLPKLIVNNDVKYKDFSELSITDFDVVGYFPHPPIKALMAV